MQEQNIAQMKFTLGRTGLISNAMGMLAPGPFVWITSTFRPLLDSQASPPPLPQSGPASSAAEADRSMIEKDWDSARPENCMRRTRSAFAFLICSVAGLWAQDMVRPVFRYHQVPDQDGVYYVGPEVSAPQMLKTVYVQYPDGISARHLKGMTVLAMVIDAKGIPEHIQVLHQHSAAFDQAAISAVKHSTFAPGMLGDHPVPVWIDVRVVFSDDRRETTPQVLITERDLPAPDESQLEDKHHRPLSYTPPFPIHTVDADFADPFANHPYIQVAVVSVLVSSEGLPTEVRVVRGLGFGLDQKAADAVWHYKFLPATRKGAPVAASRNVMVSFAKF